MTLKLQFGNKEFLSMKTIVNFLRKENGIKINYFQKKQEIK